MRRRPVAAIVAVVVGGLSAACAHPRVHPPAATPAPGIAIALYADTAGHALAIIDDRRWVDIAGDRLVLADIESGVALSSLVIEPLAGPGALAIHACGRDRAQPGAPAIATPSGLGDHPVPPPPPPPPPRAPRSLNQKPRPPIVLDTTVVDTFDPTLDLVLAPTIHCVATGAPGRYLVRVLYSSTTLAYHAEHEITVAAPDRAHLASHLAITTPAWLARDGAPATAAVVAYAGLPGGDAPPVELARDRVVLDGSLGVLALPTRDVPARIRRVLAASQDISATDLLPSAWIEQHRGARLDEPDALVWIVLELPGTHLAPGLLQVRVNYPGEEHPDDLPVAPESRDPSDETDAGVRLRLWPDDGLRASIQRGFGGAGDRELIERYAATIANIGSVPREIFVEEKLRPGGTRAVSSASPAAVGLAGNTLREKLVVDPTKTARTGFVVTYRF